MGAYSIAACLSHLTIDLASLSRRRTVPTPARDTSNIFFWALITLLSIFSILMETFFSSCCIPFLFRRLWPP